MRISDWSSDVCSSDLWSVTVAAIEQPGESIAITDRANRLVCANSTYLKRFGIANAPPNLLLTQKAVEALTRIARTAWRESKAGVERYPIGQGHPRRLVPAERPGAGKYHMICADRP